MKKILALVMVLIMILATFAACSASGNDNVEESEKAKQEEQETEKNDEAETDENSENENAESSGVDYSAQITAKKIGNLDLKTFNSGKGGIYYKDESDKCGIITFDGKNDTGAIYTYCSPIEEYFIVSTKDMDTYETIEDLNNVGLVDNSGKEIIPEKFASISIINENYAQVYKVTEKTDNKDEALLFMDVTPELKLVFPDEKDLYFKGIWYIYDLESGKQVDGVSGTNSYGVTADGNFIHYYDDKGSEKSKDGINGLIPEVESSWDIFSNGSYLINDEEKGIGTVYDTTGKELFTYDTNEYKVYSYNEFDHYYRARINSGDDTVYCLIDANGEVVSNTFKEIYDIGGNMLVSDGNVCDFDGNILLEGEYSGISLDPVYNGYYYISAKQGGKSVDALIKADGTVLCEKTDNISVSQGVFYKDPENTGEGRKYYCVKDADYTIESSSSCLYYWLIEQRVENNSYNLIETVNGETIIEDYKDYKYNCDEKNQSIYIYAELAEGGFDIYEIVLD